MSRSFLLALALGTAIGGLAGAETGLAATQPGWPQATSDLPADPAVRFGVLANGMRYAIMKNATPPGQASLRLRIGSGSLEENDAEQGLAHVLEHMAFKGSTHIGPGEMVKMLEREGLAFGADTNASTEWTQTVFKFDLPKATPTSLDTGLLLLREIAGELNIDPAQLETERGVVLSEERLRDTPEYRASKAQIDLLLHGQLAAARFPIGMVDIIQHAPASLVRSFYQANYRPDRATLIAVGDFDPARMEAQIKARFADWTPKGDPGPAPDLGSPKPRGPTVKVVELPGAQTGIQIAWVRPYDASPDTVAKERRETIENLGLAVLNRRLSILAQAEHPPFLSAQAGFENLFHSGKVAIIEASSAQGAWRPALDSVDADVRRLIAFGVGADELQREITEMRTSLANAAAGAATRPTPELANGLVDTVDDNEVDTAPAEDLALFEADAKGLAPQDVNAAIKTIFAGAGPLVELTTPTRIEGGEATVAEAFAKAQAAPIAAPAAQVAIVWPYASFGAPGAAAERREIADLGLTRVRFANGVGLTVKSTAFRKDQVLVSIAFGHGRLDLPKDHAVARWAASAFTNGGFKAISLEDSHRALAGRLYGANFNIGNQAFDLSGATQPKDLATQLQVLAAYVAAPGFRPEAFERARAAYLTALPQMEATPEGVLGRDLEGLITGGDPRFTFPSGEALAAAKPGDLPAFLQKPLAEGPLEVTIVGDVTVDQAIALTAATFGALPARPAPAPPAVKAGDVRFPAPTATPVTRTDTGRVDQAMAMIAWPLTDFFADMARARATMLAGEVLLNRILDKVRIEQGATYSPDTVVDLSETFPGYGYALSLVEMPPAKLPGFFASVSAITADMRAHGVTPDELARARNPRVASIQKAQATNEYWLGRLSGSIADSRQLDLIRTSLPDYEKIGAADIQAAAKAWFVDDKAWKLVIQAAGSAASSP